MLLKARINHFTHTLMYIVQSHLMYNLTKAHIVSLDNLRRFSENESCHLNRSHFLNPDSLASHLILHLISSHGFNQSAMNSVTANSTPKAPSCIFHHLAPIAKSLVFQLTNF